MHFKHKSQEPCNFSFAGLVVCCLLLLATCSYALASNCGGNFCYDTYASKGEAWFSSEEAIEIGDNLLSFQMEHGGWWKLADMVSHKRAKGERIGAIEGGVEVENGTFDNDATTEQMRYLAAVYNATNIERFKDGFLKGLEYIFRSQYPSGGWPQVYPLRSEYSDYVTFNDNVMTNVLRLLKDIVEQPEFAFVDSTMNEKARKAFERGINYILKSQIRVNGTYTAWCQQHDPVTYEPRPGRTFEPVAIASHESVGVIELLLSIDDRSEAIDRAIAAAIEWLRRSRLEGVKVIRTEDDVKVVEGVPDSHSWARFYEIGTNRPIFSNPDGIVRYSLAEIEQYRRKTYSWYGDWGDTILLDYGKPGTQKWQFKTGDRVASSPAIGADGTIYVGSDDGNLYTINPDGTEKWRFKTGHYVLSSPAIGTDGTIYVVSNDGNLYAINPDGTEKWNKEMKYLHPLAKIWVYFGSSSSPAIGTDDTIYAAAYSGSWWDSPVFAINPDGTEKWIYWDSSGMRSPAIGPDGIIYGGDYRKALRSINPDGTNKWKFYTKGHVYSSPAIGTDGTVYVGSWDNNLYAINPDGTEKWRFETGDWVCSSPAIGAGGTVYVGSYDNNLYAINPDGTEKWRFKTGDDIFSSPAIGADNTIYIGSCDGNLYAINPDGTEKWRFKTGGDIFSSPAIGSDGTIYVGSDDGNLYAINSDSQGLANSPWPKFRHDSRNSGSAAVSITVIPCWDVNQDGMVDVADLVIVGQHFGEAPPTNPRADVNKDGAVNILDLVLVGKHFGESTSPAAPHRDLWVVEPEHLPILKKLYIALEENPNPDLAFQATKAVIRKLLLSMEIENFTLLQNYPNPANPETWIPYQLREGGNVIISIYDAFGKLVKRLNLGYKDAGLYTSKDKAARWDGRNEEGESVASGVYFYQLKAGYFTAMRKMVIVQ